MPRSPRRTPRTDHSMFSPGECVEFFGPDGRWRRGRVAELTMIAKRGERRGRLFVTVLTPAQGSNPDRIAVVANHLSAQMAARGAIRRIPCPNIDHPFWRGKIARGRTPA